MEIEQVLVAVNSAFVEQTGRYLTDVEAMVLKGAIAE
jgi:hypothetical protein